MVKNRKVEKAAERKQISEKTDLLHVGMKENLSDPQI